MIFPLSLTFVLLINLTVLVCAHKYAPTTSGICLHYKALTQVKDKRDTY